MFSGCSDGSYWPGGFWWSFQMKVWTLKIQRNLMIPNYSMIPAAAIRWSPGIRWSPAIRWSNRSMDFDNRKVYGDTSITDGLVYWWTLYCMLRFPIYIERWISEKPSLRLLLQLTHRRIREEVNEEKNVFFRALPEWWGGVYPCPIFLALFLEVHFWSIKRVYFFKNANVLNF